MWGGWYQTRRINQKLLSLDTTGTLGHLPGHLRAGCILGHLQKHDAGGSGQSCYLMGEKCEA